MIFKFELRCMEYFIFITLSNLLEYSNFILFKILIMTVLMTEKCATAGPTCNFYCSWSLNIQRVMCILCLLCPNAEIHYDSTEQIVTVPCGMDGISQFALCKSS